MSSVSAFYRDFGRVCRAVLEQGCSPTLRRTLTPHVRHPATAYRRASTSRVIVRPVDQVCAGLGAVLGHTLAGDWARSLVGSRSQQTRSGPGCEACRPTPTFAEQRELAFALAAASSTLEPQVPRRMTEFADWRELDKDACVRALHRLETHGARRLLTHPDGRYELYLGTGQA
jgi:hypothetical protein